MTRLIPSIIAILVLIACVAMRVSFDHSYSTQASSALQYLPVRHDGKIQSLDTLSRKTLTLINEKDTLSIEGKVLNSVDWLSMVLINAPEARVMPVFRIRDRDILAMIGHYDAPSERPDSWKLKVKNEVSKLFSSGKVVSYEELEKSSKKIFSHAMAALQSSPQQRNAFENEIIKVAKKLNTFRELSNTLSPGSKISLKDSVAYLNAKRPTNLQAIERHNSGLPYNQGEYDRVSEIGFAFQSMEQRSYFDLYDAKSDSWLSLGTMLKNGISSEDGIISAGSYISLLDSLNSGTPSSLVASIAQFEETFKVSHPDIFFQTRLEVLFNSLEPFRSAAMGYILALLPAIITWIRPNRGYRKAAIAISLLAYFLHSCGLLVVYHIDGISAILNGDSKVQLLSWLAVTFSMVLIFRFRSSIGIAATVISALVITFFGQFESVHASNSTELLSKGWIDLIGAPFVFNVSIAVSFVVGSLGALFVIASFFTGDFIRNKFKKIGSIVSFGVHLSAYAAFAGLVSHFINSEIQTGLIWNWEAVHSSLLVGLLWNVLTICCWREKMISGVALMALASLSSVFAVWTWLGVRMLDIPNISIGLPSQGLIYVFAFAAIHILVLVLGLLARDKSKTTQ